MALASANQRLDILQCRKREKLRHILEHELGSDVDSTDAIVRVLNSSNSPKSLFGGSITGEVVDRAKADVLKMMERTPENRVPQTREQRTLGARSFSADQLSAVPSPPRKPSGEHTPLSDQSPTGYPNRRIVRERTSSRVRDRNQRRISSSLLPIPRDSTGHIDEWSAIIKSKDEHDIKRDRERKALKQLENESFGRSLQKQIEDFEKRKLSEIDAKKADRYLVDHSVDEWGSKEKLKIDNRVRKQHDWSRDLRASSERHQRDMMDERLRRIREERRLIDTVLIEDRTKERTERENRFKHREELQRTMHENESRLDEKETRRAREMEADRRRLSEFEKREDARERSRQEYFSQIRARQSNLEDHATSQAEIARKRDLEEEKRFVEMYREREQKRVIEQEERKRLARERSVQWFKDLDAQVAAKKAEAEKHREMDVIEAQRIRMRIEREELAAREKSQKLKARKIQLSHELDDQLKERHLLTDTTSLMTEDERSMNARYLNRYSPVPAHLARNRPIGSRYCTPNQFREYGLSPGALSHDLIAVY
eukprot:864454_1